nr:reverse transcriptase domain-containing protein [Tanacetum cinerariifolium]
TDGPTVPTPPKSITPEVGECVVETYTDPDLAEYIIKVPPPPVQKYKPPSQRNFVVHTRDSPLPNIPYPSRMLKQKQQEKDEVQIQNELKYKVLANLGASINLMPLSVWKELGLTKLIPTRMTLELANRAICTPDGIARDVFVSVGKFTFPADFVVVDYKSDPRVPLILGRPFLRSARVLIDVHEIEFLLYHGKDSSLKDSIDQTDLANLVDYFVDPTPEMFTDEQAPDYSSPSRFDVYEDDFLEVESDFLEVFNPGILIHEKTVKIIARVAQDKKLAISYASLVLEDFDPP